MTKLLLTHYNSSTTVVHRAHALFSTFQGKKLHMAVEYVVDYVLSRQGKTSSRVELLILCMKCFRLELWWGMFSKMLLTLILVDFVKEM